MMSEWILSLFQRASPPAKLRGQGPPGADTFILNRLPHPDASCPPQTLDGWRGRAHLTYTIVVAVPHLHVAVTPGMVADCLAVTVTEVERFPPDRETAVDEEDQVQLASVVLSFTDWPTEITGLAGEIVNGTAGPTVTVVERVNMAHFAVMVV